MKPLWFALSCLIYSGISWSAPWVPPVRDGTWLQKGIQQQQRWSAHEQLSDEELSQATIVTAYVCAIVDLEKDLIHRATLLSEALESSNKKKKHLNSGLMEGMRKTVPILLPLAKGDFDASSVSCDKAVGIVRGYLEKYPEILDKDAESIVEKALIDAY